MNKFKHQLCKPEPSSWISFSSEDTILLLKHEQNPDGTYSVVETITLDKKTGEIK